MRVSSTEGVKENEVSRNTDCSVAGDIGDIFLSSTIWKKGEEQSLHTGQMPSPRSARCFSCNVGGTSPVPVTSF